MAAAIEKIRSRLFVWNADAWNHRLRMILLTPLLILAGGAASILVQSELTHRGFSVPFDGALTGVFILSTMIVGYVLLALID